MKNLLKITCLIGIATAILTSCKKDEPNLVTSTSNIETSEMGPTQVAFGPDLLVTLVSTDLPRVTPSACGGGSALQATCGSQYTLKVRVTNIGNAPTASSYTLGILAGGQLINRNSPSSSLAPGASDIFTLGPASFSSCSGIFSRQSISTFADIGNVIIETNEGNNRSRPYFYCAD